MNIIAVCSTTGPKSGKSTYVEKHVKQTLAGSRIRHERFSDPIITFLVDGLRDVHGQSRAAYEDLKREKLIGDITGRDIMIAVGEGVRSQYPSFYADVMVAKLAKFRCGGAPDYVVIDDTRKIPELNALVNTQFPVLFVNILKSTCGHDARHNDSEFTRASLRAFVDEVSEPNRVRLLELIWDGKGGLIRA